MTKLRIRGGWEEVMGRDVWGEPAFSVPPTLWELPPVWVSLGTHLFLGSWQYPQSDVGR